MDEDQWMVPLFSPTTLLQASPRKEPVPSIRDPDFVGCCLGHKSIPLGPGSQMTYPCGATD